MKKTLLYISLIGLTAASCKKEALPNLPESNDPIYTISGEADGESFDKQVGVQGTEIEYGVSSFNGMPTYYGEIHSEGEEFAIRIELIQPEILPADPTLGDFVPDDPEMFVHNPGCVLIGFGDDYTQLNNLLVETDDDVFESMNAFSYREFGLYTGKMKFTDVGPGIYEVPIRYGFEYEALNPKFVSSGAGDTCKLFSVEDYTAHEWYVNGELISTDPYCSTPLEDGVHKVRHVVYDEAGNSADYITLVRFGYSEYMWQMQYDYCTSADQSNQGKMMISYKKDGVWYHSKKVLSNGTKHFNLSDKIKYLIDPNTGQLILAHFDIDFTAELEDEDQTGIILLENVTGHFALGAH